jgi:hypothetical protein
MCLTLARQDCGILGGLVTGLEGVGGSRGQGGQWGAPRGKRGSNVGE